MYRILHITSGTFLRSSKISKDVDWEEQINVFDYPVYESETKQEAKIQLNSFITDWINASIILEEELISFIHNEPYWNEKACDRFRDQSEFEIVKVT